MKKYLAILSEPYDSREAVMKHIARTMSNGIKKIKRVKLFTLYILSRDRKYYYYRVCRIVTEQDIENSIYTDESKESWRGHLEAHTGRIMAWLNRKTTKIVENNRTTLSMLEGL